jgi:hypothetical protein
MAIYSIYIMFNNGTSITQTVEINNDLFIKMTEEDIDYYMEEIVYTRFSQNEINSFVWKKEW